MNDNIEHRLRGAMHEIAEASLNPDVRPDPANLRNARRSRALPALIGAAAGISLAAGVITIAVRVGDHPVNQVATDRASHGYVGQVGDDEITVATREEVDLVGEKLMDFEGMRGFGKVRVDYSDGSVTIYWRGSPPPSVSALDGAMRNRVRIRIEQSYYDRRQFLVAGRAVADYLEEGYGAGRFSSAAPNRDMSRLVVEVVQPWSGDEAELTRVAGIPVSLRLVKTGVLPAGG